MDNWLVILMIIIAIIFIAYIILLLISHLYFHRSLMATLAEIFLRVVTRRRTNQEMDKYLNKLPKVNDILLKAPKWLEKKGIKNESLENLQYFYLEGKNNNLIIYLHGGCYVRNPRRYHFRFIYKLFKKINATIIFPIYTKAPNHTFIESYDLLIKLYKEKKELYTNITLMGDSSGGGLALGLALKIKELNFTLPNNIILLSPWVDLNMNNPEIEKYEKVEPLCYVPNCLDCAKKWSGGKSLNDWMLSPINGNFIGLNNVFIFVGTREVLYPDCVKLYDKLKNSNINTFLYEGVGLNHVYPIYPIPEAKTALNEIVNLIKTA